MSDKPDQIDESEIPETDFRGAVRGKYYERAVAGTNLVLLESDVAKVQEHGGPPSVKRAG